MSSAGLSIGHKRKADILPSSTSSNPRKRQKFQDARVISTQTADAALTKNGELNIGSFIKAREFEIAALDKSMKKARQNLSSRAFQQVPRHLRRRTASHNAKKVPRRLRSRAKREMIEDNTPLVNSKTHKPTSRLRLRLETAKALQKLTQKRKTVRQKKREAKENATKSDPSTHKDVVSIPRIKKNTLANPPSATSKFKRRQVSKTWLPTHLWHTKRAHMTKSVEPLWRMAIPLRPTEKSYRATHRATTSRGCIAWDMSYISTLCCRGTDTALEGLLRTLGFHGYGWRGQQYKRWKCGSRFATGWVCKSDDKVALGIIDVFWCAKDKENEENVTQSVQPDGDTSMANAPNAGRRQKRKLDCKIMIRTHPSTFYQFWSELLRNAKLQKPQVLVEDLRFEIGSIDVMGPGSVEALSDSLKLSRADEAVQGLWDRMMPLSNPALLPLNPILSFSICDPRLLGRSKAQTTPKRDELEIGLHEMMVNWPFDTEPRSSPLFSHKARYVAGKLPSQWTLNRQRQKMLPGQTPQIPAEGSTIPIILLAHRPQGSTGINQGSWTLLAPWKCIDVIWRRLLHSPLSSGRVPRFGGLREKQQVAFQQSAPWFPCDYPGTEAGKAWETMQSEKRFDEWLRRPPSRRPAWQSLDLGLGRRGELGRGWTCDWEYLLRDSSVKTKHHEGSTVIAARKSVEELLSNQPNLTQRHRKAAKAKVEAERAREEEARRRNTSSPETSEAPEDEQIFTQLTPLAAKSLLHCTTNLSLPSTPALATVKIVSLSKGTPNSAARIYRLPTTRSVPSQPLVVYSTDAASFKPALHGSMSNAAQWPRSHAVTGTPVSKDTHPTRDLRSHWLALDPDECSRSLPQKEKKERVNHRGLPNKAQHYEAETLRHINVLPKNAPPEIQEQYGAKALSEDEKRAYMEKELAISIEEQKIWDRHVPCPDAEDLIGFVTSGGYNLAEGRGTAIGAVWVQRVLKGWTAHDQAGPIDAVQSSAKPSKQTRADKRKDRERHLCVVRNAGESVGRLAIWEVCE